MLKTVVQATCFWVVFLLVIPWLIYAMENSRGIPHFAFRGQGLFACVGFVLASCLGLWSGVTMAIIGKGTPFPSDTARELVIRGPYRFVRNPMAIAGLAQGTFVGIALGSCGTLLYVLAGMMLWNTVVRPMEEADLAKRFGHDFDRYRRSVRCWLPTFRSSEPVSVTRIVLFDGVCNLCNASVQFIIRRDPSVCFHFASRQSAPGRELLERHGLDPQRDDSIVLLERGRVYLRSTAALRIARRLRWPWPLLFGFILVPRFLRDPVYNWIAANRYRWFGKSDTCMLPPEGAEDRFLPGNR